MSQLDAATLHALATLLYGAGMDAHTMDHAHLAWVLRARVRALRAEDLLDYTSRLANDPDEAATLVESLLIRETRFFRDPAVFTALGDSIAALAAEIDGPLLLASAPCSTGQEPYSLAAAATLAGVDLDRLRIDAFDLSATAIAQAIPGVYSARSVSHLPAEQRDALGTLRGDDFIIHPALRQVIRFSERNLATPQTLGNEPRYHVILCRNLLIYTHAEARREIANSLQSALLPGGRLVLGSGDLVPEISALFTPIAPASASSFIARNDETPIPRRHAPPSVNPKQAPRPNVTKTYREPAEVSAHAAESSAQELLQRARQAQNAGNLRLAERRCRQALYLEPSLLPAMELLDTLWHSGASVRLRRALAERIHRVRSAHAETGGRA